MEPHLFENVYIRVYGGFVDERKIIELDNILTIVDMRMKNQMREKKRQRKIIIIITQRLIVLYTIASEYPLGFIVALHK